MSTVRIYKVAELLGTSSQEVAALLKRLGIDAKSASSTIEEVVARQFVERLARERNISLPSGDIFAEAPAVKGKKGAAPPKKGAEPAKPAGPLLPPPRLVKTAKPAPAPAAQSAAEAPIEIIEPADVPPPADEAPSPVVVEAAAPVAAMPPEPPPPAVAPPPPVASAVEPPEPPEAPAPRVEAPTRVPTPGRVVPPTLRLPQVLAWIIRGSPRRS